MELIMLLSLGVFLTKESEQVRGSIDLGHGCVRVVGQDVGVLRPFKLIEELGAQHDVEIFTDASNHLIHSIFSG